jgi:hypothetical protein
MNSADHGPADRYGPLLICYDGSDHAKHAIMSAEELERWLGQQVARLRAEAPHGTVRLSRLTQELPSVDLGIGWLLERELREGEPLLAPARLAEVLMDMRLLGLEPTLLAPHDAGTTARAA